MKEMVTCLSVFTIVHVHVCTLYNGQRSIKGSLLRIITIDKEVIVNCVCMLHVRK